MKNHIISTLQLEDKNLLFNLFEKAKSFHQQDFNNNITKTCKDKILGSLFYEPSTRTRMSFESAMIKLWGNVITTENATAFSSTTKWETLEDTIKILWSYTDIIVLRHYEEGSADRASKVSEKPVINAWDGIWDHPTQALLDIYTIWEKFKDINNKKITLIGDLINWRTIHSLIRLLSLFDLKVNLVSPEELKLPEKYKNILKEKWIQYQEYETFENIISETDVFYVTRVQKERFSSFEKYEKLKNYYIINQNDVDRMKQNSIIMHPLPRTTELPVEIDSTNQAVYFQQAKNWLYTRMALLDYLLNN